MRQYRIQLQIKKVLSQVFKYKNGQQPVNKNQQPSKAKTDILKWKDTTGQSSQLHSKKCLWLSRCNAILKFSGKEVSIYFNAGEKVAETGKVPFRNCVAHFNKQMTISCNMILDTQSKQFKEKQTKFAIVIYTQKGNKQAGEVLFDVAPFLNERNQSKSYELGLSKCPDKNAKICFSLKAKIIEEKAFDTLSQSSLVSVDIQQLTGKNKSGQGQSAALKISTNTNSAKLDVQPLPPSGSKSSTSIMSKTKDKKIDVVPTTDRPSQFKKQHQVSQQSTTDRTQINADTIKQLQAQNKKIREQLKRKQQLKKDNEQLKRKLKEDDYQSCKDYKKKLELGKKEIETLNNEAKGAKKVNEDIKKLEKEILKCKQHIMRIFNQAQKFGPEAMGEIQQACGFKEY